MTTESDILALFGSFLESPTSEKYSTLRDTIVASEFYEPYADDLSEIRELIGKACYQEAQDRFDQRMPNLILSPRAHLFLALLVEAQNAEREGSELERSAAFACAEAILQSGDGSQSRPFLVLRTSDEYDVLEHLGKVYKGSQRLVHQHGRHYDVLECADGDEIWFDISDAYRRLNDRIDTE